MSLKKINLMNSIKLKMTIENIRIIPIIIIIKSIKQFNKEVYKCQKMTMIINIKIKQIIII
jgi:hypothetical protein